MKKTASRPVKRPPLRIAAGARRRPGPFATVERAIEAIGAGRMVDRC